MENKERFILSLNLRVQHWYPFPLIPRFLESHQFVSFRSMASDRGQNRYSDFMALETLLRFQKCSSSHCLLSSWRRFHVFESSHPSFHRTVFFGTPLAFLCGVAVWAYVVIASFLCLRVIWSSFSGLGHILGQVLDVWGHIFYRLYLHKLYLPFFCLVPCYSVTLLPCYLQLLLCYLVTLLSCYSLCHFVNLFPCYLVTLLPCDLVIMHVTLLLCNLVILLLCYLVTLLLYYSVILLLCHFVTLFPCYLVTLLPYY